MTQCEFLAYLKWWFQRTSIESTRTYLWLRNVWGFHSNQWRRRTCSWIQTILIGRYLLARIRQKPDTLVARELCAQINICLNWYTDKHMYLGNKPLIWISGVISKVDGHSSKCSRKNERLFQPYWPVINENEVLLTGRSSKLTVSFRSKSPNSNGYRITIVMQLKTNITA